MRLQFALFFNCEFVPAHGLELGSFRKTLARWHVAFLDSEVHHRAEDRHFKANGGVAYEGYSRAFG